MDNPQENEAISPPLNSAPSPNRRYIVGFFATMFAFNLIELYFFAQKNPAPNLAWSLLFSLIIGQISLLSIWAGLGRFSVTLRCFACLVFIESWCLLLPALFENMVPSKELFNYFLPIFLMIAITLWIGRLLGLQLINIEWNSEQNPSHPNRYQFSIRCLLEWVTIAAIFMASLSYIFGAGDGFVLHRLWWLYATDAACNAVLALSLTWAVLGIRWITLRVIQAIILYVLIRFLCLYTQILPGSDIIGFLLYMAIFLVSLMFFRSIGYRVTWRGFMKTNLSSKAAAS